MKVTLFPKKFIIIHHVPPRISFDIQNSSIVVVGDEIQ